MASERRIIPDLYFPGEDQELQTSSVEGKGGRGQGGGLEGGETVDLTPEGFIPIHKLTLEDLPEPIRTEEFLQYIQAVSTRVVRINNNGLSDLRPDDDQFKRAKRKSLTGSGILPHKKGPLIVTNRHVLFNEEELWKSTFDVFFDYHHGDKNDKDKRFKRCVRTNGKWFYSKSSKEDIVQASYRVKDSMEALINDQCVDVDELSKHRMKLTPHLRHVGNKSTIVCLVSHPLGQPKQVSFGEMVNYDMPSRTVHHTAPSKPGSSGGHVIIFSESLFLETIVHVGTELLDGEKYKYARINYYGRTFCLDFNSANAQRKFEKDASVQTLEAVSDSVEIASLAAFFPIFGAFLSREVETRLGELDTSVLTPCKVLVTDKPWTSYELKQSVKECIEMIVEVAPSATPFPLSNLDDASTLLSLLESQGPCFCQSIVKMMERGVKREDGTVTECFLAPYTAAAKMSSDFDGTWPWLNGRSSDLDKFDGEEGCLLQKCLKLSDREVIPVMLLLMIARANVVAKELQLKSGDPSSPMIERDFGNPEKIVGEKTKQEAQLEQNREKQNSETQHISPLAEKVRCSSAEVDRDWHRLTADVVFVMFSACASMTVCAALRLGNKHPKVTKRTESEDNSKLYSACLAVSEHAWHHEWQVHPDTEHSGHDDSNVNWCRCGRPVMNDVSQVLRGLISLVYATLTADPHVFTKKLHTVYNVLSGQPTLLRNFTTFIEEMEQYLFDKSLSPESLILLLDKMDSFPRGRHTLMVFLASREVFLYNVRIFARQISKHLQPRYFAFPVSMYGRPGNWPGNVTPPEVQRTAWRLIQDAIKASGFPPALLAALDKDTERREKLIDLYVDMKQLKWQGRIQPHLFWKHLERSSRNMMDHLQRGLFFEDPTHYFVWYASFLVCPQILTSQRPILPQCPLM